MENIDDLMRQKFDSDNPGERFEFQEEYWEQAQALLEQEEDKRRKRWWLFFALILLISLLGWLLLGKALGGAGWSHNEESKLSNNLNPQTEAPSMEPTTSQNAVTKLQDSPENQSNTGNQLKNNSQSSNSNQPIHKFESSLSSLEHIDNQKAGNESQSARNAGKVKHGAGNNPVAPKGKGPNTPATSRRLEDNKKELEVSGTSNSPNPSNAQAHLSNPQSTNTNNPSPITNDLSPVTNNQSPNPPIIKQLVPTNNLPIPPGILSWPVRVFQLRTIPFVAKELIAEQIKPVENKRFSLGLSLAGSAYQADTLGRWAGWAIGAFGDYRLNKNWSVMLGAQWRFVPGYGATADSSNPDRVEQLRYSFGFKKEYWKRETRGLHYLEIPLSARWNQKRWGLEAGAATGLIFLVQNKTIHTTESSLEPKKTTVNKWVRGDVAAYNTLYFNGFFGAEYRLTNRVSLMARGQYRFTPVFKSASDGEKNRGLGNLDLGLRLRLF